MSLLERHMIDVTSVKDPAKTFSLMQMNCLADHLSDSFPECPGEYLRWDFRKVAIVEELTRFSPDVICAEEVDHFDDFLEPQLRSRGYAGIFQPKDVDGVCIFYRTSRFVLHSHEVIRFREHIATAAGGKAPKQVAVVAVLVPAGSALGDGPPPPGSVCVAVTHLKAKPPFEELRVQEVDVLVRRLQTHYCGTLSLPVLLAGDFNAEPIGCSPIDGKVWDHVYRLMSERRVTIDDSTFEHALAVESCYRDYRRLVNADDAPGAVEPEYTTWKVRGPMHEYCRTIDYIWYTPKTLTLRRVLSLPSRDAVPPGRLPCATYPSDHFSIMAEVELTP